MCVANMANKIPISINLTLAKTNIRTGAQLGLSLGCYSKRWGGAEVVFLRQEIYIHRFSGAVLRKVEIGSSVAGGRKK